MSHAGAYGRTAATVSRVARNEVEVGIAQPSSGDASVRTMDLCQRPVMCVVNKAHPLSRARQIKPGDLTTEPLISFGADTPTGAQVADMFRREGAAYRLAVETNQSVVACALVSSGLGVAIVDSFMTLEKSFPNVVYKPFHPRIDLHVQIMTSGSRPLSVVVDAGNGMAGYTVPAVLGDAALDPLPLRIEPLYFELDGTFPNHEANPLEPANLVDLQDAVRKHGADVGLAFDGDADRCFVVDENGDPVSPSAITALVATRELVKHPGGTVIHNLITSSAVPQIVAEHGGTPLRSREALTAIPRHSSGTGSAVVPG